MSLIDQPTQEVFTNYFPNPEFKGNGTFAEVARNFFTNPRLKGDGTWAEVRHNYAQNPCVGGSLANLGGTRVTLSLGTDYARGTVNDSALSTFAQRLSPTSSTAAPGDVFTLSALGRTTAAGQRMAMAIQFLDASNVQVGWGSAPETVVNSSTFTPLNPVIATVAPSGTAKVIAWIGIAGTGARAVGDTVDVQRVLLEKSPTVNGYFDGNRRDLTMPQPGDFRVRWLGTPNASESVMEIERVRGLTGVNCIPGLSSVGGVAAVRQIPTAPSSTDVRMQFGIPSPARGSGTFLATAHLLEPLAGPLHPVSRTLRATLPTSESVPFPNAVGEYPIRLTFGALSSLYEARFYHGGALGSGDVWWTDIGLFAGTYNGPIFNGSSPPNEVDIEQPEDFRFRWLGAEDNSESVMEIEQVQGIFAQSCIAGVSSRNGKPAMRLIPTSATNNNTYVHLGPTEAVGTTRTLVGTVHLDAPLTGTLGPFPALLRFSGHASPPAIPNSAGTYPQRLTYTYAVGPTFATARHGGAKGSGDVWWTDIGLFADDYDGPAFSGDTEELYYRNQRVFPYWTGEPGNSPSEFTLTTHHNTDPDPIITEWNPVGKRFYEAGIDRGMLYTFDNKGVPWNGLTAVNETPQGGSNGGFYVDGVKFLNVPGPEEYAATLKAFTYPEEFEAHDGSASNGLGLSFENQPRRPFGLCYRTRVGNDVDGPNHAYKLHIIFNALASPSSKDYNTLGEEIEPVDFSWALSVTPEQFEGKKATAHLVVDSRRTDPYLLRELEEILYGTEKAPARLPTGAEINEMFDEWVTLLIIDHGDGTYTAVGPDDVVKMVGPDTFVIDWSSAEYISPDTYTLTTR